MTMPQVQAATRCDVSISERSTVRLNWGRKEGGVHERSQVFRSLCDKLFTNSYRLSTELACSIM